MELYQLEYFRVLCKHNNYTRAAAELLVTQPTLSMAIKRLEDEVGMELINHEKRGFSLTKKGESLLSWAITIHNDMEGMRSDLDALSQRKREIIRLGLPLPLCPEIFSQEFLAFTREHVPIAFHIIQKGHVEIIRDLLDGNIDIGIISKDLLIPSLDSVFYNSVEFYCCFPEDSYLGKYGKITPQMLNGQKIILSEKENGISQSIQKYLAQHNCENKFTYVEVLPEDLKEAAKRGEGIAFSPKHSCEHRNNSLPLDPPLYGDLYVVWVKDHKLTQQKQEFISFLSGLAQVCLTSPK